MRPASRRGPPVALDSQHVPGKVIVSGPGPLLRLRHSGENPRRGGAVLACRLAATLKVSQRRQSPVLGVPDASDVADPGEGATSQTGSAPQVATRAPVWAPVTSAPVVARTVRADVSDDAGDPGGRVGDFALELVVVPSVMSAALPTRASASVMPNWFSS